MTDCPYKAQLNLYHDGELDSLAREVLAGHLKNCAPCGAELESITVISNLLASSSFPSLSQMGWHRLHDRVDAVMDRGLLRLGWSLSAVAAGLLLVGSVWLAHVKEAPQAPPPWINLAVSTDPVVRAADSPAAQWYLADASISRDNHFEMDGR